MRRSHRVIVEISFEDPISVKDAVTAVRIGLSNDEMAGYGYRVTSTKIKEAERVLQAELRHRNRIREQTRSRPDEG